MPKFKSFKVLFIGFNLYTEAILKHLAAQPARLNTVVLLERPAEDEAKAKAHGATVRFLNIQQATQAALGNYMQDFDTVVDCMGIWSSGTLGLKLVRAALEVRVPRYVPGQFAVDCDAMTHSAVPLEIEEQREVRRLLRTQRATEWVIFSLGVPMELFCHPDFGVVDLARRSVRCLGNFGNSVSLTSVDDAGVVIAHALNKRNARRVRNEIVWAAGCTITYHYLAATIESELGRSVTRIEGSIDQLKKELADDPEGSWRAFKIVLAEGKGVNWHLSETWSSKQKLTLKRLDQWAKNKFTGLPYLNRAASAADGSRKDAASKPVRGLLKDRPEDPKDPSMDLERQSETQEMKDLLALLSRSARHRGNGHNADEENDADHDDTNRDSADNDESHSSSDESRSEKRERNSRCDSDEPEAGSAPSPKRRRLSGED